MKSRQRLLTTLNHQEPDRIPFDQGSTQVTGIHVIAYRRLRRAQLELISESCPGAILRQTPHARLFLDADFAPNVMPARD